MQMPSYRAFKALALADLTTSSRCSSEIGCAPFRQQQRLLRIHLRHALRAKSYKGSNRSHAAGHDDGGGGAAWMHQIRRSVAAETLLQNKQLPAKKQLGVTLTNAHGHQQPEQLDLELSDSERTSQFPLLPQIHNKTTRNETHPASEDGSMNLDLISTSRFIPLQQQHGYGDLADSATDLPAQHTFEYDHERSSYDTQASTQPLHAFEFVVELLSARDLAVPSSLFPTTTRVRIGAELALVHQTKQIAVLSAPSIAFLATMDDVIHWDDAALRFGFDSSSSSEDSTSNTAGYDPKSVINEGSLSILVKVVEPQSAAHASHTSAVVLGKIEVPLALLETPLAQDYAMARWFPLERPAVGVPTRGDIRVSITFSMRDKERLEMTVYKPKLVNLSSVSGEPEVASKKTTESSSLRRGSRKPLISAKPRDSGKASPQRDTRDSWDKTKQPQSGSSSPLPRPSGATAGAPRRKFSQPRPVRPISPNHRCPKVEAFSPPSSPSSFSSENLDETARSPKSPPALSQQQPRRKSSLASKRTATHKAIDSPEAEDTAATAAASASSQPFLKRKPYKVVFRKLDWSSVGSRTDSSWDAKQPSAGTQASGAADTQPPTGAAALPKKRGKQAASGSQTQGDGTGGKKNSVELNPATAHRLQTLSSAIYECCRVSQTTAPLAHMKYQAERTKYVQQLQSPVVPTSGKSLEASSTAPSEGNGLQPSSASFLTSTAALSGLWKALVKDASGELYATKLQQLLLGDENALNPTDYSTKV